MRASATRPGRPGYPCRAVFRRHGPAHPRPAAHRGGPDQPPDRPDDAVEQESDLNLRIPVDGKDEISRAAMAFNTMLERFSDIIRQVGGATRNLSQVASHLVKVTTQTQAGVDKQLSDTELLATTCTSSPTASRKWRATPRKRPAPPARPTARRRKARRPPPAPWGPFPPCRISWDRRCRSSSAWIPIAATSAG